MSVASKDLCPAPLVYDLYKQWPLFYESKVLDVYTVCWNTRLQLQRNNTAVVALHLARPVVCYRRVFLLCRWN